MKFKLKERELDASWREEFVFWRRTQDNYRVILDRVWVKDDITTGKKIYRVEKL